MRETSKKTTWSHLWCTLLLLLTRAAWSLPVVVGILVMAPAAKAAPEACPKVMAQTPQGVAIRIGEGCDLFRVVRAHPLIDPETGRPYPMQIQLRSIYAANQDHYEDGVFVRRSVMRNCARPGKPDPYADKDELENVCKNGDGLAYYFGIPGVRILIPSKRQFTQAESAEMAQKQLDDELAAQQAAEAKRQADKDAEKRIQIDAGASAKISDLESRLDASQAVVASLRTPASRGRLFWGMVIGMLCLALYGVGSTTVAVRARRIKPVIASGQYYPDVETASEILSGDNVKLKSDLATAQREASAARTEVVAANARIARLEGEVAAQSTLLLARMNERDDAKRECEKLRSENRRLAEEGDDLNKKYLRLEVELKDRQRPSFRPPGMESDVELRRAVTDLREANKALEGVRERQFRQIEKAGVELTRLNKLLDNSERIRRAIEFERDQAIEASRSAQARVANLRLVKSLPDITAADDDEPTEIKDRSLALVAEPQNDAASVEARHSVPPPPLRQTASGANVSSGTYFGASSNDEANNPLSSVTCEADEGLVGEIKDLARFLDETGRVKQERFQAKLALDSVVAAVGELQARLDDAHDAAVVSTLSERLTGLGGKVAGLRAAWEALCEKENGLERIGQAEGYNRFQLRSHSWQTDEATAGQEAVIAGYRAAVETLSSVIEPEEIFVGMAEEMSALKSELKILRTALEELEAVAHEMSESPKATGLTLAERVRHVVGTLTDVSRQWLVAAKQAIQSQSSEPPAPQTISDFVRCGTLASRQPLGDFSLPSFQKALSEGPSYLVADAIKACVREWLQRVQREGERVLTVYTLDELFELNSFLCSPLIGGSSLDLSTTIGRAIEGHKVHHASDTACRHPALKQPAQSRVYSQTMRPGQDGFNINEVAAQSKRNV